MIDMHSHVDLYPDPLSVAQKTNEHNSFTLAVTTSPRAWQATSRILSPYKNIAVALGMHPEIVWQKARELDLFLSLIPNVKILGEIGLDGSARNKDHIQLQKKVFEAILIEADKCGGRILSIHSRGAGEMTLQNIMKYSKNSRVILHWFSGTNEELKEAISLGCFFSLGPAALLSRHGRELAAQIPLDRILPESDGPFARINGKSIFPWESNHIDSFLADLYKIPKEQISYTIKQNLSTCLAIDNYSVSQNPSQ
ncbi:hydrolase TatD [Victivallales bacterium CCUG 44730]|nr:hydrolase TatD [Victivallales bacterium CCUG 44730]